MLEGSGVIAFNTPPIAVPAILNGEISDNEVKESFKVFTAESFLNLQLFYLEMNH
jgi:hypothetical protein